MAFTYSFSTVTQANTTWLDANFNAAGLLGTLPCTVAGTNTLTLTPIGSIPAPNLELQSLVRVSGVAVNNNTGATTAAVAGLSALPVYKDTPSGPTVLSGGEIVADNSFVLIYDAALDTGGGWHLETSPANAAGTVTSVGSGTGLTGGPITGSGTLSLASISNNQVLANITGSSGAPSGNTLSAILDAVFSNAQGGTLSRGASLWAASTETSFVPALSFGGSSTGITYSTQVGQYMQLGYLVVAMFNIVLSSKGSQTGAAAVSLPVVGGGTSRVGGGLLTTYSMASGVTGTPILYVAPSGSVASLYQQGTGAPAALTNSDFGGSDTIAGIFMYLSG